MSSERIIYLNGEYVPEHEAKVSVLDRGFRWGGRNEPTWDHMCHPLGLIWLTGVSL